MSREELCWENVCAKVDDISSALYTEWVREGF